MTLLPIEFNTVTVHGQYVNLDGTPVTGYLTFAASPLILKASQSKDLIVPIQIYAGLDTTGSFSVDLPATDDPDINPADWTYQVVEGFGPRRTYSISVRLENGPSQNIYDLAPVTLANGTYYLQGEPGPAGGAMLTTTGKPSSSVGVDGDEALDFATGILYRRVGQNWDNGTQLGTSAATPSAMVVRDGSGAAAFAKVTVNQAPVANADAARKDYVDTSLTTHAALTTTHGVAGLLVGTTDTQTLSNKILSAPAVTGGLGTDTVTASGTVTALQAVVTATAPTAANQLTRKDYVDSADATTLASAKSYTDGKTPAQASSSTPGTVQLAGDLGGTATAPTVTGGTHHTHTSSQISDATSSATANTLALRDASGNTTLNQLTLSQSVPQTASQAARKDYVDNQVATKAAIAGDLGGTAAAPTVIGGTHHTHTSAQVSDATSAATASMVVKRDAAGRASVADPSASTDIATKNYVDGKGGVANGFATLDATAKILSSQLPAGNGSDQGYVTVDTTTTPGTATVTIGGNWGLTDAGQVYYDPAGAVAAEAGMLVPDADGNGFSVFRPGGPWVSEDQRVATMVKDATSRIYAALAASDWATCPVIKVRQATAAQSIPSGVFTPVTWDTKDIDTAGTAYAAGTTSVTIPRSGYYWIQGGFDVAASIGGRRGLRMFANRAGTDVDLWIGRIYSPASGPENSVESSGVALLQAGDKVRLEAWQESGATQAMNVASDYSPTVLSLMWMRY